MSWVLRPILRKSYLLLYQLLPVTTCYESKNLILTSLADHI